MYNLGGAMNPLKATLYMVKTCPFMISLAQVTLKDHSQDDLAYESVR